VNGERDEKRGRTVGECNIWRCKMAIAQSMSIHINLPHNKKTIAHSLIDAVKECIGRKMHLN